MSRARGGRAVRWTLRHALGAAADAAALLVADALLETVSVTATGVALALVALHAPFFVLGPPHRRLGPLAVASMRARGEQPTGLGCLYLVLLVGTFAMLFARVPLAALVVPGFDIDGLWSYVATIALTFVYPATALRLDALRRL